MKRIHLYESVDLPFCPQILRDGVTDWVRFMLNSHQGFNALVPKLRMALDKAKTDQVIDLCSGGGGPWLTFERALAKSGEVKVLLTDLFPNRDAFRYTAEGSQGRIRVHP